MGITKYIVKVDGVQTKVLDLSDIKSGLATGAHTITAEAWNGSTLISTQTKNITIAATLWYETVAIDYKTRVQADAGTLEDEAALITYLSS